MRTGDLKGMARIALRRVERLYFKTDAVYDAMRRMTMQQQAAQAAGEAPVLEEERPDEGADLGEEDEPAEDAAAVGALLTSEKRAMLRHAFRTGGGGRR